MNGVFEAGLGGFDVGESLGFCCLSISMSCGVSPCFVISRLSCDGVVSVLLWVRLNSRVPPYCLEFR
jgi:hypothetical protein